MIHHTYPLNPTKVTFTTNLFLIFSNTTIWSSSSLRNYLVNEHVFTYLLWKSTGTLLHYLVRYIGPQSSPDFQWYLTLSVLLLRIHVGLTRSLCSWSELLHLVLIPSTNCRKNHRTGRFRDQPWTLHGHLDVMPVPLTTTFEPQSPSL